MPELIYQFMHAEGTRNDAARTPIKTNILPFKLDRILFTVDHHGSHNDTLAATYLVHLNYAKPALRNMFHL